jgi:raffinose synthase
MDQHDATTKLSNGILTVQGVDAFDAVDSRLSVHNQDVLSGVLLRAQFEAPTRRARLTLGHPLDAKRFVCCYRYDPYWMVPRTGSADAELPAGTLYALFEKNDGSYLLVVPLVDEPFSGCLQGAASGVEVIVDSGCTEATSSEATAVFVDWGKDPYALIRRSAASISAALGFRLRSEKTTPAFVDRFGWCTWDAFYRDVSLEAVARGLESFREGGVEPRFMILDDGWQTVDAPTNEGLLTAFAPNEKFGGSLASTVELAKGEFGIEQFLVWHAVYGYWGGTHPQQMADYEPRRVLRWYCPEVLTHAPDMNCDYCGPVTYCPSTRKLPSYYDDYHASLKQQGVDGVKVDNQASVEGLGYDDGGRVTQMKAVRGALEGSTSKHFGGALINCMSCSAEMFYLAADSTVTRTSTDFWPRKPATHGLHVYTNAFVSLWFGEFVQPDWDMFQSGHPVGSFHAAARAISGGPVYVSDKPNGHDFELLKRLILSDGSLPRPLDIARPTRDSLFSDPTKEESVLKLFNTNAASYVVGAFNARYRTSGDNKLETNVGPSDIPQLKNKPAQFAVHCSLSQHFTKLDTDESVALNLDTLEYEIVTLAPIREGIAPIGLLGLLNPGGAIRGLEHSAGQMIVGFADGGQALLYSERAPLEVTLDGKSVTDFEYEPMTGRLLVELRDKGPQDLLLRLDS